MSNKIPAAPYKTLGEASRYIREEHGLSQTQLALKIGISRSAISKWESGEYVPNVELCIVLADFYGCSLDELVGRERKNDFE